MVESSPTGSSPLFSDPGDPGSLFAGDLAGDYVLSLVASDGIDTSAKDFVTIQVVPVLPPVAIATADINRGSAPLIVSFDGSQSLDPQGGPLTMYWNFGDGNISTEPSPTNTYIASGQYSVLLEIFDDRGQTDLTVLTISVLGGAVVVDDFEVAPFALQATSGSDPFDQVTQTGLSVNHVIGGERRASLTVNEAPGSSSAQLATNGGNDCPRT